jgi:YD repeat-containing protein
MPEGIHSTWASHMAAILAGWAALVGSANAQSFTHDLAGRLTQVRYDAAHSIYYQYDTQDNLTNLSVSASQAETDTDTDGMPDAWEWVYFNTLTNTAAGDPNQDGWSNLTHFQNGTDPLNPDTDGDGASNIDENLAGTDPTDPTSRFEIAVVGMAGDPKGVVIRWRSATGRYYRIRSSTNLITDPFTNLLKINIKATAPLNTETDTTAVATWRRFYRIELE